MAIQNGKRPLSTKNRPSASTLDDIFGSPLGLDPGIVKAIEAKGLSYRFVSVPALQKMGGYHNRGWRPLLMKELGGEYGTLNQNSLQFGGDPDGYLRRGDLVLAVRPKDMTDKHRAFLRQEALLRSNSVRDKAQAEELRNMAKRAGLDTVVESDSDSDE
jgi:hypothetical protein